MVMIREIKAKPAYPSERIPPYTPAKPLLRRHRVYLAITKRERRLVASAVDELPDYRTILLK
jgi:hypothetical protein